MSAVIIGVVVCILQVRAQHQRLQQGAPGSVFIVPENGVVGESPEGKYDGKLIAPENNVVGNSDGELVISGNDIIGTNGLGRRNKRFLALGNFFTGPSGFGGRGGALTYSRQPALERNFFVPGSHVYVRRGRRGPFVRGPPRVSENQLMLVQAVRNLHRKTCLGIMICTTDGKCVQQDFGCRPPTVVIPTKRPCGLVYPSSATTCAPETGTKMTPASNPPTYPPNDKQTTPPVEQPKKNHYCVTGGIIKDILCSAECHIASQGNGYCSNDDICMCMEPGETNSTISTISTISSISTIPTIITGPTTSPAINTDPTDNTNTATTIATKSTTSTTTTATTTNSTGDVPTANSTNAAPITTFTTTNPTTTIATFVHLYCLKGNVNKHLLCDADCRLRDYDSGYCTDTNICVCETLSPTTQKTITTTPSPWSTTTTVIYCLKVNANKHLLCDEDCRLRDYNSGYCTDTDICICETLSPTTQKTLTTTPSPWSTTTTANQGSGSVGISLICLTGGIFKDIVCATECRLRGQGSGSCTVDNVCLCKEVDSDESPEPLPEDKFCQIGGTFNDIVCANQCSTNGQSSGYCTADHVCMCVEVPNYGQGLRIG